MIDASHFPAQPVPSAPAPTAEEQVSDNPIRLLFDLDDEGPAKLRQAALITDHLVKRPLFRKIDTVFWDTADHLIGQAKLGLGVETIGRRKMQIMRRLDEGAVVLDAPPRAELLMAPTADRPDPIRLAFLPGADPELAGGIETQQLLPLFAVTIRRTQWLLAWKSAKLLLWLDEGIVTAASGEEPVLQLSMTNADGPPTAVYEFARELAQMIALPFAALDAASRGYSRIMGDAWAMPPSHPALDPDMPVRQGILAIGQKATAGFRNEVTALTASQAAGKVHQARVAIRKLRSVLTAFSPLLPDAARRSLARDLGKLASALGEAREWDVFLTETIEPLDRALHQIDGDDQPLKRLGLTAKVLREQSAASALDFFEKGAVIDLSLRLSIFFEAGLWDETPPEMTLWQDRPLSLFAEMMLRKRHRKLKHLGESLTNPSPTQLHELRIEAKKLRYLVEFFASLYPGKALRRYLATLRRLQDTLGILNDAAVTQRLVPRLAGAAGGDHSRAAGIIAGWTASEATQVHGRFAKVWAEFLDLKRFW